MKIAPVLAAVVLAAGCSEDGARPVQVGSVVRATVGEVVEAPGTVVARATSAVTSPVEGSVASVDVRDGAQVRRGDVLLRLSSAQPLNAGRPVDALTVRAPIDGVVTLGAGARTAGGGLEGGAGAPPGAQGGAGGGAPAASTTTNDLSPGAPVSLGTALLTVTDLSALSVLAEVDETDVLSVTRGTRARIELDAVPGPAYQGAVASVDLAPTTSVRGGVSYRVRLSLSRGDRPAPRPGMSAVVKLQVRQARGVLAVPTAAVVRDGADDVVFLVLDGRAVRRVVRTGAQGEESVELREGVAEGDRVVTRDADSLSDGDELDL